MLFIVIQQVYNTSLSLLLKCRYDTRTRGIVRRPYLLGNKLPTSHFTLLLSFELGLTPLVFLERGAKPLKQIGPPFLKTKNKQINTVTLRACYGILPLINHLSSSFTLIKVYMCYENTVRLKQMVWSHAVDSMIKQWIVRLDIQIHKPPRPPGPPPPHPPRPLGPHVLLALISSSSSSDTTCPAIVEQ